MAGKFDIIALSETFLNFSSEIDLDIPGYLQIFRKDRTGHGGGVAIFVSNFFCANRLFHLERCNLEVIWVEIKFNLHRFVCAVCYRPPTATNQFWDLLQDSVENAKLAGYNHVVVTGDLNADPGNRPAWDSLHYFCETLNLNAIVTEPTRLTNTTSTILDQILITSNMKAGDVQILPPIGRSDHCQVTTSISISVNKPHASRRRIWLYNQADWDGLNEAISLFDWDECFLGDDVHESAAKLTDSFIKLALTFIPNKCIVKRPWDNPWYTSELRRLRRRRDRLFRRAKRSNSAETWHLFRASRNTYVHAIKIAKEDYLRRQIEQLNCCDSSKSWWLTMKGLTNFKRNNYSIPALNATGGNIITSPTEKAQYFNSYFLKNCSINSSSGRLPDECIEPAVKLENVSLTQRDILDVLLNLNPNKASGVDQVSPKMLKRTAYSFCVPLTRLFNMSLQKGQYPDNWKLANVTPILKKGDPSSVNNYRPISLLSSVSKVMEKAVFKYVFNFLRDNEVIYKFQSGFMPGHCTTHQLVYLYHLFSQALDKHKPVRIVFGDISKAFDRVWHSGIIYKLKTCGITGSLNKWFASYLHNRKQQVVIDGCTSDQGLIEAGVPQGSVLGPLLFLVFINDMPTNIETNISLFADDSLLFNISNSNEANIDALNRDLARIERWSREWLVTFNSEKTVDMTLSSKPTTIPERPLTFLNRPLNSASSHKHLGLIVQHNLSWGEHITEICAKADRRLSQLNFWKFRLNRKTLEILYKSYIRPILEYGNVVFDNMSEGDSLKLESVQKKAGKIVSGAVQGTTYNVIIEELGWESLRDRRQFRKLALMWDIVNHRAPYFLNEFLPETVQDHIQDRYPLRNRHNVSTFHTRTELFRKSFFPSTVNSWNTLDNDVRAINDLSAFKHSLRPKLKSNPYFYCYERKINVIISRMRMRCSALKAHLFANHVSPTPNCVCGLAENTEHYFFHCPLYANARINLTTIFNENLFPINVDTILHGLVPPPKLSKLVEAVTSYILDTERF